MKKLEKMSIANVEGKLTRNEMKTVIGGKGFSFTDYLIGEAISWTVEMMYKDYQSRSGAPYSASGRAASMGPY